MKKKISIHKKNEIIRGADDYSVMAKRALNTVYWAYQRYPNSWKHDTANISFATIRKMMNLESDNRYVDTIKEALIELRKPTNLNNYYHPIDQCEYAWYSMSFLDEAGFKKDDKGEWFVTARISRLIAHLIQQDGNFTPLELIPYANSFRTKYAMKLYEYLRSFRHSKYLNITQKHMMTLLALDENSKYKYMSDLTILIERQLKDIAKKSDLTEVRLMKSKTLQKERTFRIVINPKGTKNVEKTEAKTALDNLIKRF